MNRRAFTLVDLLIVISVISLLSSFIISNLKSSRDKAENARTIMRVMDFANGLAIYQSEHEGLYPPTTYTPSCPANNGENLYCLLNNHSVMPNLVNSFFYSPYLSIAELSDNNNNANYFCLDSCKKSVISFSLKGSSIVPCPRPANAETVLTIKAEEISQNGIRTVLGSQCVLVLE